MKIYKFPTSISLKYCFVVIIIFFIALVSSCGEQSTISSGKIPMKRSSTNVSKKFDSTVLKINNTTYTVIDDYSKWVSALYVEKKFDVIEQHISEFLSQKDDEAKAYELYTFYYILTLGLLDDDKNYELKEKVLNEWCNKHMESHIPWLVRGAFYIDYAWHFRGDTFAKDVPQDAWPKFYEKLSLAKKDLEKSWHLNPRDPNSSCFLIIVAKGLNYPMKQMDQYYDNGLSACPFHFGVHYQKLDYLTPRWHGSSEMMFAFAEQCLRISKQYPYLGLIMVNAFDEVHKYNKEKENILGRDDIWPAVKKIYDAFFTKYPNDIRRRFFYAYHAYKAQKYDIAIEQFEIIGDQWMGHTRWRSLEHYHSCRAFAYSAYGVTLPPEQGIMYLRKSIVLNPTDKVTHYNLGVFDIKIGQHEEAETALLKAIEFDPCMVKALLNLSWLYGKIKRDPVKAKEYAEKVLECNPDDKQKEEAQLYIRLSNKSMKQ